MSTPETPREEIIAAAGAVPWRRTKGGLEVSVVHRPAYDDWSWPKGKADPGEDWPVTAVREVAEETGLVVRLGVPLPSAHYRQQVGDRAVPKEVRYWAAEVAGGDGRLDHEIDALRWVVAADARELLTYSRDHDQLDALLTAHDKHRLATRPFALVRHAKALGRRHWSEDDWLRPLDTLGHRQANDMSALLQAYGIRRLLSSTSTRCLDTLKPYAEHLGRPVETTWLLSEEGYAKKPKKAAEVLLACLRRPTPSALCSHGPVLPDLLETLAARSSGQAKNTLRQAARHGLGKGEVLVAHLSHRGKGAPVVVAVERHPPAAT